MSRKASIAERRDRAAAEVSRLTAFGHGLACSSGGPCNLCRAQAGLDQLSAELESLG